MTRREILTELARKRVSAEAIRRIDYVLTRHDRNRALAARIMRSLGIDRPCDDEDADVHHVVPGVKARVVR
jgi:hypothetical protein